MSFTSFGHYQVLAKLGEGGMGQVYRARDTRLDRDVAIKVLPPHLAADEAARARFEREAKAVAALSHPNILAIHDVGTEAGTAYAVMELLEGETLRARLSGTAAAGGAAALPIRKAVQIGIDLASALAAAHDKQIVHRDIKPENIFISADGRVKILDFGLARQAPAPAPLSGEGATELQQTDPGTVLGTIGYMAPEQVKAQQVDHRADIFALGCVLYEMASGRRPFARETAAETMSAILRDDPPDLTHESGTIPAGFDAIVRHCLEKRPEERFQSARDLGFALQSTGTSPAGSGATAGIVSGSSRSGRGRVLLAGLAVIAVGTAAFLIGRASGRDTPAARAGLGTFQQATDTAGVESWPALSPDGKTLVFVSDSGGDPQIYSQRVGSRTAVPLTQGGSNASPAISPDGERIAFWSSRDGGGIFLMSATGESVTRVTDEGFTPTWSPAGDELALAPGSFVSPADLADIVPGLAAIDLKSGARRDILRAPHQALQPVWSPNGHRIAYFALRTNSGQRDIFTVAANGSEADAGGLAVTDDAPLDWSPAWSPDGRYLYFSSNRGGTMNLWRVPIDERSGRTLGAPEPMTTPSTYSGWMSFSRDGSRMAYASVDWRSTLLRQALDPVRGVAVGPPTPVFKGSRPIRDHAISPDGQWVAFNETGAQEDLFVARIGGGEYRRLTDDPHRDRGPSWMPDGSRIIFYSDRGGSYDLWSIRPDGSQLQPVTIGGQPNFAVFSPDGRRIASSGARAAGFAIRDTAAPPEHRSRPEPAPAADEMFWPFSWSPDGTRLIGISLKPRGLVAGVLIYDVAAKTYQRVLPTDQQLFAVPEWLRDNRRFLIRMASGIWIADSEGGPKALLTPIRGYFIGRSLSVAPDGRWYTYTETGTEGDIWIGTVAGARK